MSDINNPQPTTEESVSYDPPVMINPDDIVAVEPEPETAPVSEKEMTPVVASEKKAQQLPDLLGLTSGGFAVMEATAPVEVWEGSTGPQDNPNVTLMMEYTTPMQALRERTDLDGSREMVFFLSERGEDVDQRIRSFISPTSIRNGVGADWNQSIVAAAAKSALMDRRFEASVRRPDAKYLQFLETEAGKLGYTAPKVAESGASGYSGEKGILRVRAIMGLGGLVSVPLWHSGFWITLSTPTEGALIELQRRLQEEKIELGRETYGLVFSNEQSYLNSWMLDFCFEHIYEYSVKVDNKNDLRSLIKIQDLNILFWGLACLVWPRGFDYIRSITTVEGIQNTQTVSAKIAPSKLMWIDNASFDAKQRAHMTNRHRGRMTIEQVKDYQDTLIPTLAAGRRVKVREGLDVLIASTDVQNYIDDGEAWITGIVSTVDSTFTEAAPTLEERNRMIDMHSRATVLRNNGAWIKAIYIDDHENTNRDDIAEVLNVLSTDTEATELLEKAVATFKDDCVRALIAIPETSGKEVGTPRFPHLIPIDVVNTFFTLLGQRVAIISRR